MHRIVTTVTGIGISNWIPVDCDLVPVNIGLGCVISATATYTLEHCFDDLRAPADGFPAPTITPFPHPFIVNQTANSNGNYAMPITAYRLNVSASTGTVTVTSLQGNHP